MRTKRILLIDDEASITRTMKVNLERTGAYSVRTENRPDHALITAREFQPDIVFLDVMMPKLDGGGVAAQFKAEPTLKKVPLIFLTAIVSKKETGENGAVIGGQMFIAKPLSLEALKHCIEEHTQE
jgi:two-component system, OmpR family, response regulator